MKFYSPRFLFRRHEVMKFVKKGDCFLEIGPGDLGLALELSHHFTVGTLMDFNTTDVQLVYDNLPQEYKQKLQLIITDFSQYNQFDSKFDCFVACEVLEHIEDDVAFLQKANNLLKEGGQLIISVPARQKYWSTDDIIVGHYRRYEKQDLQKKLTKAGYSQIRIVSYGFPFQNLIRMGRIILAKMQYKEKANWGKKSQSQQSAFMIKRKPYLNLLGIILNKYTFYPLNLVSSLFNKIDFGEGYVVSAEKSINQ